MRTDCVIHPHRGAPWIPGARRLTFLGGLLSAACGSPQGSDTAVEATGGSATGGRVEAIGGQGGTASGGMGNSGGGAPAGGAGPGGGGSGSGGGGTDGGTGGVAAGGGGTRAGSGGAAGTGGAGGMRDVVTRTASTYTFQHFTHQTNSDGVYSGAPEVTGPPTSTTYDTVILENGYTKVTLLPDYGGRILSIVHKPTNRELLYQNPLGTPYLMFEGIFYYDYLVILGGIFPSFPEPEHGKYWNQPYQLEVLSETPEAITVRMSRLDDLELTAGVPARYDVGRTDVLVEWDVTLRAGSTSVELDTKVTNTRSTSLAGVEYWTVTTLAPGSTPGETAVSRDARILAQMDQVHLLESSWSWFGDAEERVSGEIFRWDNLSYFENWVDQGVAFASPGYQANYSGLIDYATDMGILRASENTETPGLKLWTFGIDSLDIDPSDGAEWLRPTIEIWHGVTPEFWERATMAPNEVRAWEESYFPTLGLREVTAASDYGAMQLWRADSGADAVLGVTATLTLPEQTVHAVLRLDGLVIYEQDVVVAASEPMMLEVTLQGDEIPGGALFEAEFLQGESSLLLGRTELP